MYFLSKLNDLIKKLSFWDILFCILFTYVLLISYTNIEQSIFPRKYIGETEIHKLLTNYTYYKYDFLKFLRNTLPFPPGDTHHSQRSFFYLLPLFSGLQLFGSFNFANLYRANMLFGLTALIMLYLFAKQTWNKPLAFFSCLFFGTSPWFQELFRSATYHGPSVCIAVILLYLIFRNMDQSITWKPLVLIGIFTGISFYYYATVRVLTLFILISFLMRKKKYHQELFFWGIGVAIISLPGAYLRLIDKRNLFACTEVILGPDYYPYYPTLLYNLWDIARQLFANPPYIHLTDLTLAYHIKHALLIAPSFYTPLLLGFGYSLISRQSKHDKFFLLFTIITILSITVSTTCQVRRLSLLIIPVAIYIGKGFYLILRLLEQIKSHKKTVRILTISLSIISCGLVLEQLDYINSQLFLPTRSLGFVEAGRALNRLAIKDPILYIPGRDLCDFDSDKTLMQIENFDQKDTIYMLSKQDYKTFIKDKKLTAFHIVSTNFTDINDLSDWLHANHFKMALVRTLNETKIKFSIYAVYPDANK